ncbi:O-antigen ligase family protein [Mycolicibacterium frederiksbergense]|uniref:O-antigen ligase family protein n=1 Tax=Mycolicibacterium frederiksbergense TaxID=117567 RepID=UPI00265BB96C|nr:O-antigen ligase family protein [Mycolicibacterium frederiksbergense]MDO0972831.1 O-antigen ligase family protein [Mycolicibacterium frederiksbergense]
MNKAAMRVKSGQDGQWLTGLLVVMMVSLPIANSMSTPRDSGGVLFAPAITYFRVIFVLIVCVFVLKIIADSSRTNSMIVWPRRTGEALFVTLLLWLFLTHLRVEEFGAARNILLIVVVFVVLCILAAEGYDIGASFRLGARLAGLLSVIAYIVDPTWYVNSRVYFSGKIVENFPNVEGLLHHGNITALFFGAALVVEVSLWGFRSRRLVSLAFALLFFVLLMTTQGRNAIAATILAVGCVLLYRRGNSIFPWLVLVAAFIASWIPLLLMLPVYFFGGTPDYDWIAALTNRGGLWDVIVDLIPRGFVLGHGTQWVNEAHPLVTDRDISEVTHAHNQILDLILVGGLPALALYGALFVAIAHTVRRRRPPVEGVGLMVILVCTSITETPLAPYMTHAGVVLSLIAIVLVFAVNDSAARPPAVKPQLTRRTNLGALR